MLRTYRPVDIGDRNNNFPLYIDSLFKIPSICSIRKPAAPGIELPFSSVIYLIREVPFS